MDPNHYNIIIHIRRGDVQHSVGANKRIKPMSYFKYLHLRLLELIRNATAAAVPSKAAAALARPVDVHIVSLGFPNFEV